MLVLKQLLCRVELVHSVEIVMGFDTGNGDSEFSSTVDR